MSRTRIVGGVYTKITGGDYKMYTEGDTIISAAGKNDFANAEKVIIGTNPEKMDFRGKGGTLLITKVESEPKGDVSPNQKVTYKVTQYNFSEKVTEADKNRIQWAIKIDDKQEVLKEKGEKLELTIKEEWAGKEIIVMPYLVKATEKVSEKVKIKIEKFPMLIVQGKKRVGKNADGSLANDLYFGDYTDWKKEKIKEKLITDLQRQNAYSDKNKGKIDKILNLIWNYKDYDKETLSKKFLGSFSINFLSKTREYFVKFLYDIKGSYHSITASNGETYDVKKITGKLLEDALQADELQEFVKTTKTHIKKHIKMNENKLYVLEIKSDETGNIYNSFLEQPTVRTINFSEFKNPSLVYIMHSIWAYKIYLEKYDKNNREVVIKYRLYDHFGLDTNDIFEHSGSFFIEWFVLQHFWGVKPFITEIVFTEKMKI
ncbi:DUF3289 family protein [Capnocytophaga sp.]